MSSIMTRLKSMAVLVIATLALVGAAEVALRLISPETRPEIILAPTHVAYRFNPDFVIDLEPGVTKTFVRLPGNGGQTIEWRTNAQSFPGAPLQRDPELRVMVYGDSNILGRFSRLENTFPYRLERNLENITGRKIETINAGVLGFGPDQSYIKMMKEFDEFRPDIVVFHIFADNDFGDIVRDRIFELDGDGNLSRNPAPLELTYLEQKQLGKLFWQKYISSFHLTLAAHHLGLWLRPPVSVQTDLIGVLGTTTEMEFEVYRNRGPRTYGNFSDHYDLDVATRPESESAREKKKLMGAVLKSVQTFLKTKNVELVILIQPSTRDLTENLTINHTHLSEFPSYSRKNLSSAVEDICVRLGLRYINFYDVFFDNRPETLYFRQEDWHWNDAGQALAARVTADYIHRELVDRPVLK